MIDVPWALGMGFNRAGFDVGFKCFGEVVLDDVGSAEADGDFFQVQVGWVVFCWETTP